MHIIRQAFIYYFNSVLKVKVKPNTCIAPCMVYQPL